MRPFTADAGRRLARRLPPLSPAMVAELLLLALLAVQCARLVWAVATPLGPVGDWRPADRFRADPAGAAMADGFDPFTRLAEGVAGPMVVTPLDLKLYGVREDRASGRGSAIIGTPDGAQASILVGEEIVPGVVLRSVEFDGVTIARGGAVEHLFLDQSLPAETHAPEAPAVTEPAR